MTSKFFSCTDKKQSWDLKSASVRWNWRGMMVRAFFKFISFWTGGLLMFSRTGSWCHWSCLNSTSLCFEQWRWREGRRKRGIIGPVGRESCPVLSCQGALFFSPQVVSSYQVPSGSCSDQKKKGIKAAFFVSVTRSDLSLLLLLPSCFSYQHFLFNVSCPEGCFYRQIPLTLKQGHVSKEQVYFYFFTINLQSWTVKLNKLSFF